MQLSTLDFVSGLMSLILVSISVTIGLIMISKFFQNKEKKLLYVGITWAGIVSPWYSSALAFILILTTGQGLHPQIYFLIAIVFTPFVLVIWLLAFVNLVSIKRKNLVIILATIYSVVFEIVFLTILFTDHTAIGELTSPVDASYKSIVVLFLFSLMAVCLSNGLMFTHESSKSDNPEIRLKGKFLSLAFISFVVGAVFDAAIELNIVALIIVRIIMISAAFEFYCGFLLPKFIKELFIRNTEN